MAQRTFLCPRKFTPGGHKCQATPLQLWVRTVVWVPPGLPVAPPRPRTPCCLHFNAKNTMPVAVSWEAQPIKNAVSVNTQNSFTAFITVYFLRRHPSRSAPSVPAAHSGHTPSSRMPLGSCTASFFLALLRQKCG